MYIVIHCGCWRGQRQIGNWGREDLGMGPGKSSSMRIFGIGYIVKFWGELRTQSLNTYGHTRDPNNDKADELAKKGAKKRQWRRIAVTPSGTLLELPQTGERIFGTPPP